MDELERLKALKSELQARRQALAAEAAAWGKCSDKAEWRRREEHMADAANVKTRLKKTNLAIVAEEQRLAAERPRPEPRAKEPKKPKPRGFRMPTTGQGIRSTAKRLVRQLEGLKSPTEETQAFLPRLPGTLSMDERVDCMTCLVHPDEHLEPGVFVDRDGVSHAVCATVFGNVFRLCDFDLRSGIVLPDRWGPGIRDQVTR